MANYVANLEKDISFLEELLERLPKVSTDVTQYEMIKQMLTDWLAELKEKRTTH